jgi:hypothetical protein
MSNHCIPVDVLVHIVGHVIVDDMLDALDVEAARCHRRRHQDGETARPEVAQRLLALTLQAVTCTHTTWLISNNIVTEATLTLHPEYQ